VLIDREFGARQDAFRRWVRDSELTTQSFVNPVVLGQLVERSLRDLADTQRRIGSGIRREQVPAEPRPVRASKFVNPLAGSGHLTACAVACAGPAGSRSRRPA
jgi:hypothetical protein